MLRWLHVLCVIFWFAVPIFMSLVYLPIAANLKADIGPRLEPLLQKRTGAVAGIGSVGALLTGIGLYLAEYLWNGHSLSGNGLLSAGGAMTSRALWIHVGIGLALVLWALGAFVIEPGYRKVIGALAQGRPAPVEQTRFLERVSRTGLVILGPTLLLMMGAPHYGESGWFLPVSAVVATLVLAVVVRAGSRSNAVDPGAEARPDTPATLREDVVQRHRAP